MIGNPVATELPTDEPPTACALLIAGLSFHHRDNDPETDAPRVICMASDGRAGFQYANDTASAWLRERFSMNDEQTKRAMRMLRDRFAEWQRMDGIATRGNGQRKWMTDY
ncbi:hypothetical protein P0D88_30700 [Paraburkholderia sp. RL18-103-BIB-C]|uniref:hypothetical protein n=1 Tax=unclassified Paraburkholderia TaxID=2615204 RepID=UPI0038BE0115